MMMFLMLILISKLSLSGRRKEVSSRAIMIFLWLLSESARAVTGRRCSHSGEGEDFLMGQPDFFTKMAVTWERKVEKSFPRWEINRHAEG